MKKFRALDLGQHIVRCWAAWPSEHNYDSLCLLPRNHAGPHEWTSIDRILVWAPDLDKLKDKKKKQ